MSNELYSRSLIILFEESRRDWAFCLLALKKQNKHEQTRLSSTPDVLLDVLLWLVK